VTALALFERSFDANEFAEFIDFPRRDLVYWNPAPDVCRGSKQQSAARAGQIVFDAVYLRDAQAYMLISMPTGTSTIFGVFQVIRGPPN
jgi:hypothetical protein